MKTISIAFCFNEPWCTLASGAISSVIRHATEQFQYDIYIVQDDITDTSQYMLSALNWKKT